MAKSESPMRGRVVKTLLKYGLAAQAVENTVGPGMPDIWYGGELNGWIECKKHADWPKRSDTPVRLSHGLLDTQKLWIRKKSRRGVRVLVLVQIARDFLVLDGLWAVSFLGEVPKAELLANALLHCQGWPELEARLKEQL